MIFQNGIVSNSFQMEYERIGFPLSRFLFLISLLSRVKPCLLSDSKGRKPLPCPRLATHYFEFPQLPFPPGRLFRLRYRVDTDSHSECAVLHSPRPPHNIKAREALKYVKVLNLHVFVSICLWPICYIRPSLSSVHLNANFFSVMIPTC